MVLKQEAEGSLLPPLQGWSPFRGSPIMLSMSAFFASAYPLANTLKELASVSDFFASLFLCSGPFILDYRQE